ncbi:galactokinase [Latilactobacillus graminis]|nr:galactokinase [Latilactobacillus graminis]QFP79785.1 galactokinase [Latilactobacillus graminis]
MNMTELNTAFENTFHKAPEASYFAPGRINLIGEHTDYNGGHVFPTAITLGTYAVAAKRDDQTINLLSGNFEDAGVISFDLSDLSYQKAHSWANYPKGMIVYLQEQGYSIDQGLDIYLKGNIPNGAGLSSSASLELLMGVILEDQFNLDIDRVDLVKTGVMVENKFIGVNSGIMDQFAVGMGQANHAILLDTNTLDYDLVPIDLQDNVIIIMNTNKRRELADSKYNERRSECEKALAILQAKNDIQSLGELDNETFDLQTYLLQDENLLKRARHAVSENQRTMKAREALKNNDLERFGKLVNASHVSLQFDYEVTGIELDTLVQTAWKQPGVLGARMTGAGFGGCAIAIVAKDQVDNFEENVAKTYTDKIGYAPSFYVAEIADGAKKLD